MQRQPPDSERPYQLVAFDVDGTLINSDDGRVVWQLLNDRFDDDPGGQTNKRRFEAYLERQITYAQWVDLDVGQWVRAGASRGQIEAVIRAHLRLVPGAREAVEALRRRGYRLAVISGTLDITLELLFPRHPFEAVFTNRIWFDDGDQIAGWEATPYDMDGKSEALASIAARMEIPLSRTVYVGDNINDVPVMGAAGLAVAFEPEHPDVDRAADLVIRDDMRGLLSVLP